MDLYLNYKKKMYMQKISKVELGQKISFVLYS